MSLPNRPRTLPARGGLVFLATMLLWLQPILLARTGVPLASIFLLIPVTLCAVDRLTIAVRIATDSGPLRWCWIGLVWALVVTVAGGSADRLLVWGTLLGASVVAPLLVTGSLNGLRRRLLWSGLFGLGASVLAVAIEQNASRSLFGLLPGPQSGERVTALHYNPNGGAFLILLGLLIVVGTTAWRTAPIERLVSGSVVIAGIWALWQTGSRGALVGLLIAAVVGAYALGTVRGARTALVPWRLIALALAAIPIAFYFHALPAPIQLFLDERTRLAEDNDRIDLWRVATSQILENPLTGSDTFSAAGYSVDNAHNTLLECALRFGIPGAVLFVLFFASLFRSSWKRRDCGFGWGSVIVLAGTGSYSMTHTGILDNTLVWLLVVMMLEAAGQDQARENVDEIAAPDRDYSLWS